MKKTFTLALMLLLTLALLACGSSDTDSPKQAAQTFFSAYKAQDMTKLASVYAGDSAEFNFDMLQDDGEDEFSLKLQEALTDKLMDFDYDISDEVIDGDTATVQVKITTYNLESVVQDLFTDLIGLAFSGEVDLDDEALMNEYAARIIDEKLDAATKDFEATVTLGLERLDGSWKVDPIAANSDLMNALTGGMMNAIADLGF